MIPAGGNDLDPDLLTVHTLVAVDERRPVADRAAPGDARRLAPAPEAREALTEELRGLLAPQ